MTVQAVPLCRICKRTPDTHSKMEFCSTKPKTLGSWNGDELCGKGPQSYVTLQEFSKMNMKRHLEWPRESSNEAEEWSLNEWGMAIAEEAGEVCGAIKRLNRFRAGYVIKRAQSRVESEEEGFRKIRGEIGGLIVYLDLLAQHIGSNLEECIVEEFNAVSQREGLPHRL